MTTDRASFPLGNQVTTPRHFALLLSLLAAVLGASALAGWALDIVFLKSVLPGGVTMKANTAMVMLFDGVTLALLARRRVEKGSRLFATVVAWAGIALGALTLSESLFGWDLWIDQWLFHEAPGAVESSSPGRMSPPAAFSFVLLGIALWLVSRPLAAQRHIPVLSALSVTVILVGGLGLLGHLLLALFNIRFWNYAGLAMHTAAGLFLLGCALLAWVRSERGLTWSLDATTTGGFMFGIVSIVAAAGLSYSFTGQLQQDARAVAHSEEVLKEIQELIASQKDLTLSLGRYLITRDETSITERARIKAAIQEDTDHIRRLTTDNPLQQRRLEQVEQLTRQRIDMSERIIEKFRQQAPSAGVTPSGSPTTGRGMSPLGTDYPKVGQQIDEVLKEIEGNENAMLQERRARSDSSATRTFLLMPVGVYVSLTMLLLGMFTFNDGNIERKRVEDSHAQMAAIVESSDDAILSKTLNGVIKSWNAGAEKMFGYLRQEALGSPMLMIFPPDRIDEESQIIAKIARGETIDHFETVRVRKDGKLIDVAVTISPIRDGSGRITGASKIARDITERKRAERMLEQHLQHLNTLRELDIAILQARSSRDIARIGIQHLRRLVPYWGATVMTFDLAANEATVLLMGRAPGSEYDPGQRLTLDEYGRDDLALLQQGRMCVVPDIMAMPVRPHVIEDLRGKGMRSYVRIPLVVEGSLVGALNLGADQPRHFSPAQVDIARSIADQLAIALRQAFLRERVEQQAAQLASRVDELEIAQINLRRLNRVYAVLSGINTLIVRVRNRQELFDEACRIAVDKGDFGIAWIGSYEPATQDIVPVASSGLEAPQTPEDYTASARIDHPRGQGVAGRAIRERQPVYSNNLAAEGDAGERRKIALRRGLLSRIALPLLVGDHVAGVLVLYARELDFFTEGEVSLLRELAGDISFALEHIAKEEQLSYLAYYDDLTGLPNRALFLDRISQHMHARGSEPRMVALVLLDLERFRMVNETLGRQGGDELLRLVAQRLERAFHGKDNLSRVSANGYGVVIRGAENAADVAHAIENQVLACFREAYTVNGTELRLAARAGIALYPNDGGDGDTLFRNAEAALQKAKTSGGRYLFYAAEMNARAAQALSMETRLRKAVDAQHFILHYQPKFELIGGRMCGMEALIRWQDPDSGLVPPGQFIPLLEETGLIVEVGRWVLTQALAEYRNWAACGYNVPRIAVNVSAIQMQQANFAETVIDVIQEAGDIPEALELEITESLLMTSIERNIRMLTVLRGMGIHIAMDDFGTGYSSLSYLTRLPIDKVKIDRSFVTGMMGNSQDMLVASTIITLTHSLGFRVIAEGVETREQAQALETLNCDEVQGYLYARPMPADQLKKMLKMRREA